MADLNLDPNYFSNRKTVRMVALLGEVGALLPIRLWCHCGQHCKDGRLKGYTEAEVEHLLEWKGEPGKAVDALLTVKYLKKTATGFTAVGFKDRQGHLNAFSKRAKNAAKARWAKAEAAAAASTYDEKQGDATSIDKQCPSSTCSTSSTSNALPAKHAVQKPPPGTKQISDLLPVAAAAATQPPPDSDLWTELQRLWQRWPKSGLERNKHVADAHTLFRGLPPEMQRKAVAMAREYWHSKSATFKGHYLDNWLAEEFGSVLRRAPP